MNTWLIGAPLVGAAGILGIAGWRHEMFGRDHKKQLVHEHAVEVERQRREGILGDQALLRRESKYFSRGDSQGEIAAVYIGGAASGIVPQTFQTAQRMSTLSHFSTVLLGDPDGDTRRSTLADLYGSAAVEVEELRLPLLRSSMLARPLDEAAAMEEYWRPDLRATLSAWQGKMRHHGAPTMLFGEVSPGGSAVYIEPVLTSFKAEYPQAKAYLASILDQYPDRRTLLGVRVIELFERLHAEGKLDGLILGDNQVNSEAWDLGLAFLPSCMLAARWIEERGGTSLNAFPDVFREHPLATLRVWVGWLPVKHFAPMPCRCGRAEALPAVSYTDQALAELVVMEGVRAVLGQPELQCLPLTAVDSPTYCYAAAPILPEPDLRTIATNVRERLGQKLGHHAHLSVTSIGYPITSQTRELPVVVLALHPVVEGFDAVKKLLRRPAVPQLPGATYPAASQPAELLPAREQAAAPASPHVRVGKETASTEISPPPASEPDQPPAPPPAAPQPRRRHLRRPVATPRRSRKTPHESGARRGSMQFVNAPRTWNDKQQPPTEVSGGQGRPPWLIPAAAVAIVALVIVMAIAVHAASAGSKPLPGVTEELVNHVVLRDYPDRPWLSYYTANKAMLGLPLWPEHAYRGYSHCLGFTNTVVCVSSDPRTFGSIWQFEPLRLGVRSLARIRQAPLPDAAIPPIIQQYFDGLAQDAQAQGQSELTSEADLVRYWFGRAESAPVCVAAPNSTAKTCNQVFDRQVLLWPEGATDPGTVQLWPLGKEAPGP